MSPPDKRRGTPGQEPLNVAAAAKHQHPQGSAGQRQRAVATPSRREPVTMNVFADACLSLGYRGRLKLYLHVRRCGFCGHPHTHTGKPDFVHGTRRASCQQGRYVVHLTSIVEAVA